MSVLTGRGGGGMLPTAPHTTNAAVSAGLVIVYGSTPETTSSK